jgi:tyrosyl-tRNA synthetase
VQIGGSDQWGNITGGIDLTRRMNQAQVYGATLPLITKADGTKFGKSESGTIWLDPSMTSPYAFYQFWLGTADADVYNFMKYFTFLSAEEIDAIEATDKASGTKPEAQGILAKEVTELVHGEQGLTAAIRISEALFSGDIATLTSDDLQQLDGLPCSSIAADSAGIVEVLVATELAKSNKMAREFIGNNAVSVNGQLVTEPDFQLSAERALQGQYFVLKRGKKLFHLGILAKH